MSKSPKMIWMPIHPRKPKQVFESRAIEVTDADMKFYRAQYDPLTNFLINALKSPHYVDIPAGSTEEEILALMNGEKP